MKRLLASILLSSLFAACGGDDDGASPGDSGGNDDDDSADPAALTYHRDVKPIIDAKCASCHTDGGIAPFPLESYANFADREGMVRAAVEDRIMPPWLAAEGCNDYLADRSLTDDQIATIVNWVDQGAAEGDAADAGEPLEVEEVALSRVDVALEMPVDYTAQLEPDDYRCFLLDWPQDSESFVSGFRAVPGTPQVVHHVIAFYIPPDQVATYEELDAADPEPGYTCFGGPGAGNAATGWLGSWAPGSLGTDYPPGTGYRVEPGSKVALQVHYNTLATGPMPDRTKIEFKVESEVDQVARFLPWANPQWLSGDSMMIPAGEPDATHSFSFDATTVLGAVTEGELPDGPFTIHAAGLHMHTLGTSGTLEIRRAEGDDTCLLDIPAWNFHWQGGYALREPVTVNPGDQLSIECHWDNTAENQQVVDGRPLEPRDVTWGEGTTDEMCLGGFYVTSAL